MTKQQQFKIGDRVAANWPAGKGREGIVTAIEVNDKSLYGVVVQWTTGPHQGAGTVRNDMLRLIPKDIEESIDPMDRYFDAVDREWERMDRDAQEWFKDYAAQSHDA